MEVPALTRRGVGRRACGVRVVDLTDIFARCLNVLRRGCNPSGGGETAVASGHREATVDVDKAEERDRFRRPSEIFGRSGRAVQRQQRARLWNTGHRKPCRTRCVWDGNRADGCLRAKTDIASKESELKGSPASAPAARARSGKLRKEQVGSYVNALTQRG